MDEFTANDVSLSVLLRKNWRLITFAAVTILIVSATLIGYVEHTRRVERDLFESKIQKMREALKIQENLARSVSCPKCTNFFLPQDNKAPFWGAVSAGTAGGAAVGAAGGAAAGAGCGVAVGGVGAFPGYAIGGGIGGIGGGIIGGLSTAWYRDRQVKCPQCGNIFKNPKN